MNAKKYTDAIAYLKTILPPDDAKKIKEVIAEHGHDWLYHLYDDQIAKLTPEEKEMGLAAMYIGQTHFGFGMAIRNALRGAGYGEAELCVDNLDDYYVEMIEKAVKD